ncbi:MAG: TIGR04423 family type III CRISPR-associated protein [Campylobacter sp.]|nr:TIGR04423 family type III CRISPR-associated protein [Campylobacter sp.]
MRKTKDEILEYVSQLKGYEGYIQFMGKKIDENDVFAGENIDINDKSGYIYEAHFFNKTEKKSISIRQINDAWFVDETQLSDLSKDTCEFYCKPINGKHKIKMAQIWQTEKMNIGKVQDDKPCESLDVLKLKKIVFAGFIDDEKDGK